MGGGGRVAVFAVMKDADLLLCYLEITLFTIPYLPRITVCSMKERAMIVAVQQPSAECTAIFTVCIV